jgi:hypothetical protein
VTALQRFAQAVSTARREFEANPGLVKPWLRYYEAKQAAYEKLVKALPPVEKVEDLWRYVQSMPPVKWLPILESEINRIRAAWKCQDCWTPMQRAGVCPDCLKNRRLERKLKAQEEKRQAEEQAKRELDLAEHLAGKAPKVERKQKYRGCGEAWVKGIVRFCKACLQSRRRGTWRKQKARNRLSESYKTRLVSA